MSDIEKCFFCEGESKMEVSLNFDKKTFSKQICSPCFKLVGDEILGKKELDLVKRLCTDD